MNVLLVCVILFALWRGYAGMKKGMVDEICSSFRWLSFYIAV